MILLTNRCSPTHALRNAIPKKGFLYEKLYPQITLMVTMRFSATRLKYYFGVHLILLPKPVVKRKMMKGMAVAQLLFRLEVSAHFTNHAGAEGEEHGGVL